MGLFGKDPRADPKEAVRELAKKMRQEQRQLDREINQITRVEAKAKKSLQDAAKKGERDVCRILAKEIVNSRRAVTKLYTSKAQINSVIMSMQNQASTMKLAGAISSSTEVMKSMQSLVKVPEISAAMQAMQREMMKAGIIEEMLEDTMESMEPEGLEEEADAEVDKVLWELTDGVLGQMPVAPDASIAPAGPSRVRATEPAADDLAEPDMGDMQERLEALRS